MIMNTRNTKKNPRRIIILNKVTLMKIKKRKKIRNNNKNKRSINRFLILMIRSLKKFKFITKLKTKPFKVKLTISKKLFLN